MPSKCGNCHSSGMVTRGFGTEKIEDEIKIVFPDATGCKDGPGYNKE